MFGFHPTPRVVTLNAARLEVAAFCDRHEIQTGRPVDLANLVQALRDNTHLAMDFWTMVDRINGNPRGTSDRSRLSIERTSHGRALPEMTLEAITRIVIGLAVCEAMAADNESQAAVIRMASLLAGKDMQYEPAPSDATVDVDGEESNETDTLSPRKGDDELRRLLFGSAYTNPSSPPTDSPVRSQVSMWLRLWESPLRPQSHIRKGRSNALTLGYALLLLTACGTLFWAHRNGSLQNYGAWIGDQVNAMVRPESAVAGNAESGPPAGTTRSSMPALRKTGSSSLRLVSMRRNSRSLSADPQDKQENSPADQPRASTEQRSAREATTAPGNIGGSGPIAVAADVMRAGLISSPADQYPVGTAPTGQGVVLQVVISKSGTVQQLHVVEGDPTLRPAAIRTVSAWRYQPYLVDGQPVEVTTTATVHFRLDY